MSNHRPSPPSNEIVVRVRQSFMIFPPEQFIDPLQNHAVSDSSCSRAVSTAIEGLKSVISAVTLPFQLVQDSAVQRHCDRIHASERILSLIPINNGEMTEADAQKNAHSKATVKILEFFESQEGKDAVRDDIVYALNRHLESEQVSKAAHELLI